MAASRVSSPRAWQRAGETVARPHSNFMKPITVCSLPSPGDPPGRPYGSSPSLAVRRAGRGEVARGQFRAAPGIDQVVHAEALDPLLDGIGQDCRYVVHVVLGEPAHRPAARALRRPCQAIS